MENDLPGEAADLREEAARGIAVDVRLRLPERPYATRNSARYRASKPAIGLCPPTSGCPSSGRIRDPSAGLLAVTHPQQASRITYQPHLTMEQENFNFEEIMETR